MRGSVKAYQKMYSVTIYRASTIRLLRKKSKPKQEKHNKNKIKYSHKCNLMF